MRKQLLLMSLFLVTLTASADDLFEIREILKHVETEYDATALGDYNRNGVPLSYGILQIQWNAIQDVNRKFGTQYTHEDAFDVACAEEIFILYIDIWTKHLEKREGREATPEDIVRIWNGGPTGYKRDSTLKYFRKYLKYRKFRNIC